jgi:hypothetical protein
MDEPTADDGAPTPDPTPAADDVATRAELLPEEEGPGSDQPLDQAEAILTESAERTLDPEATRQESTQTPDA